MATIHLVDFDPTLYANPISNQHLLFSYLKKKINSPKSIPFSLDFTREGSVSFPSTNNHSYFSYEVYISYKHNSIFVSGENPISLIVLNINTRDVKKEIPIDIPSINCFHIEETSSGDDFIYFTCSHLYKYDLGKLLSGEDDEECRIWKSEYQLANAWGMATFQSNVFVGDYSRGVLQFDKQNGTFQKVVKPDACTYGIAFTPEQEMLVTSSGKLEILERHADEWVVKKCKNEHGTFQSPYSIFYEPTTKLIYVSDCGYKIVVLHKDTLKVVKVFEPDDKMNYAIQVDRRNGTMYVCSGNGHTLALYH